MKPKKGTARDCGPALFYNAISRNHRLRELLRKLERAAWVAAYTAEEARQRYGARRQVFRQAGACVVLALLRLASGRHA